VTTIARSWQPLNSSPENLLSGFDQEAAAAIMTKLAIFRAEVDDINCLRWIDRHLIHFMNRYSTYTPKDQNSVSFSEEISLYPQFMFYFRRGPLVNLFGCSPDQTSLYRHYLLRENVANCLIMIQPQLDSYGFDTEEPLPCLLAISSVENNTILLLDTYFVVLIFNGKQIASWKKEKFHESEEYSDFKELLEVVLEDANNILENRFPIPFFIECDQGDSQSRYLTSVLDPTAGNSSKGGDVIFSEDIPLDQFMDHLNYRIVTFE